MRVLGETYGVHPSTVWRWMKQGRWQEQLTDGRDLDIKVEEARKRAILSALQEFSEDPKNVALQSLVGLLRAEERRLEPAKELREYIIKFLDQTTDFFIEKEYDGLLKEFKACTHDLAEYLRVRNS